MGISQTTVKIVAILSATATAVVLALDPSVQVALIMGVASIASTGGVLLMGILLRKDNRDKMKRDEALLANQLEMKNSVDGALTKILDDKAKQSQQILEQADNLVDTKQKLSHAEGRREGIEVTEQKKN